MKSFFLNPGELKVKCGWIIRLVLRIHKSLINLPTIMLLLKNEKNYHSIGTQFSPYLSVLMTTHRYSQN